MSRKPISAQLFVRPSLMSLSRFSTAEVEPKLLRATWLDSAEPNSDARAFDPDLVQPRLMYLFKRPHPVFAILSLSRSLSPQRSIRKNLQALFQSVTLSAL